MFRKPQVKQLVTGFLACLTMAGAACCPASAAPNLPVDPTTSATSPDQYAAVEPLSTSWVLSYPTLIRYTHMPVLMPSANLGTSEAAPLLTSEGFPDTDVNIGPRGYQVSIIGTTLPPWTTDRPYSPGNKTTYTIAGCVAEPGPAFEWLGIAPGQSLSVLPGLPISLRAGITGYVVYNDNLIGNGGSDTTVRWRVGSYLYAVSIPLAPDDGGLQDAVAAADHMVLVTSDALAQVTHRTWNFHVVTSQSPYTTYDETVTLKANPQSLPAAPPVADASLPTSQPAAITATHGSAVRRGFEVTWRRTQSASSDAPKTHLSIDKIVGAARPGGVVQVQGTITPAPHPGVRLFGVWDTAHGSYKFVTFAKNHMVPNFTDPQSDGYAALQHVKVSGTHFTASLAIPQALYAPTTNASNRWALVVPGTMAFTLAAYDNRSPFFTWETIGHIKVSGAPVQSAAAPVDGPYTVTQPTTLTTFPPSVARALAQYGLGSDTVDAVPGVTLSPPVPELLPAWVPPQCAPFPYVTGTMPYTAEQSIPGGYIAVEYRPSVNVSKVSGGVQASLPTTPSGWATWLKQTQLLVYGTSGPDIGPETNGQPINLGHLHGMIYTLQSGTWVRFTWDGTHYGVYLAGPVNRTDAILTARSMTELQPGQTQNAVDVVLAYGQLIRDAKLGDSTALSDAQGLWQSTAAWEEPSVDSELDKTLLSWNNLQVKVLWSGWQEVEAQFSGLTTTRPNNPTTVTRTVRFKVSGGGQLAQQ